MGGEREDIGGRCQERVLMMLGEGVEEWLVEVERERVGTLGELDGPECGGARWPSYDSHPNWDSQVPDDVRLRSEKTRSTGV